MTTASILDTHFDEDGLAAYLGKCTRTLKRWRDRGDGPPHLKLGGTFYYNKESVTRWLASLEQGHGRAGRVA